MKWQELVIAVLTLWGIIITWIRLKPKDRADVHNINAQAASELVKTGMTLLQEMATERDRAWILSDRRAKEIEELKDIINQMKADFKSHSEASGKIIKKLQEDLVLERNLPQHRKEIEKLKQIITKLMDNGK